MLMRLRFAEQILAADPPFKLEEQARWSTWFPYVILCQQDKEKYLPEIKKVYEHLCEISRNHQEIDERANLYFLLRRRFLQTITEYDPPSVSEGEKAVAEIDALLEKQPLGKGAEDLYSRKYGFLEFMARADPKKYKNEFDNYIEWLRKFVTDNEKKLTSPHLYFIFHAGISFDTPEKREYGREQIARFRKLIDSNDESKRFEPKDIITLRWHLHAILNGMLFNDLEGMTPEVLDYINDLEKKNDPELNSCLSAEYRSLWNYWLHHFGKNSGTDEELDRIFHWMEKHIDTGKENYMHMGHSFDSIEYLADDPYEKCTSKQKELFIRRYGELIKTMEKLEAEWKAAKKPMSVNSHVENMRRYWEYLQLPGEKPELQGTTVDGKPFDVASLRGKVVLLDIWATWCGPCRREFPKIRAVYDRYKDRGFEVVTVSIDEDKAALGKFLDKEKLPWVTLHDPKCLLLQKFHRTGGAGYYFLLDRDGAILSLEAKGETLEAELKKLLPEQ